MGGRQGNAARVGDRDPKYTAAPARADQAEGKSSQSHKLTIQNPHFHPERPTRRSPVGVGTCPPAPRGGVESPGGTNRRGAGGLRCGRGDPGAGVAGDSGERWPRGDEWRALALEAGGRAGRGGAIVGGGERWLGVPGGLPGGRLSRWRRGARRGVLQSLGEGDRFAARRPGGTRLKRTAERAVGFPNRTASAHGGFLSIPRSL